MQTPVFVSLCLLTVDVTWLACLVAPVSTAKVSLASTSLLRNDLGLSNAFSVPIEIFK